MIADDNPRFSEILRSYLSSYSDFDVVTQAFDGAEALAYLETANVDVLLLDIIMPVLDGICVLERLRKNPAIYNKPIVIVISAMQSETIAKTVMSLGADFYFVKPLDLGSLANRIRELRDNAAEGKEKSAFYVRFGEKKGAGSGNHLEREVTNIIQEIGVPPHIQGYQFLRDAILLIIQNMDLLSAVTTELYPMIAEKYDSNSTRVERAMRHAIEVAWNKGRVDIINKYFGYTVSDYKGKPTNSEFIAMIADWVRLRSN
ncbi:MAG: sporulation transcription factor Spo0A [Christensenellales bacterium]